MAKDLRQQCKLFLSGHFDPTPAQLFSQMAQWSEKHEITHDTYGDGAFIQEFEQKVAELLGFEAAVFVITGTMNQPTALQIVCDEKRCQNVAMHESSHIIRHESQGYQVQNRFNVLPLGNVHRTWNVDDLRAWPDEIAAALYELPMREIGGQLPDWEELEAIKDYCQTNDVHLHMDGARLWECGAYYQKTYKEIANGFNSAYVSLYKGINGLGGSLLLGSKAFIEKASLWMKRQGGNVYHRTPFIVSAAMQFDERLAQMPALFERTKQVYQILQDYPQFIVNPKQPQSNMLHLYLPVSVEEGIELRDKIATRDKIWIGNPSPCELPHQCKIEWYVGDNLLNLPDHEFIDVLDMLVAELS
ncbi:low specificity L-threonine aldolase [Vibrio sp. THAF190c]|uniref:threonine aldolase family protein n=1 Tax=Vibrio sp. THAF190c TaxID=2587865 RepID=UPI001268874D|nr:beta-eliminating lyase-related protein [Vibrio sp. THAF190c]QFT12387.1 L-allo-threonine aldolase [Vibrio sp. THAF190c]